MITIITFVLLLATAALFIWREMRHRIADREFNEQFNRYCSLHIDELSRPTPACPAERDLVQEMIDSCFVRDDIA